MSVYYCIHGCFTLVSLVYKNMSKYLHIIKPTYVFFSYGYSKPYSPWASKILAKHNPACITFCDA